MILLASYKVLQIECPDGSRVLFSQPLTLYFRFHKERGFYDLVSPDLKIGGASDRAYAVSKALLISIAAASSGRSLLSRERQQVFEDLVSEIKISGDIRRLLSNATTPHLN